MIAAILGPYERECKRCRRIYNYRWHAQCPKCGERP